MGLPNENLNAAGGEANPANDCHLFDLSDHLLVSWENSALVLIEMGMLEYPSECPNHHLAMDNFKTWRKNHLKRKRHHFNQRFIKRWGKRLALVQDSPEGVPFKIFEFIGCHRDLVVREIFTKLDGVSKKNDALVCKAWEVDIREITLPPNYARILVHKVVMFVGEYYKMLVARGLDRSIYTIQFKCACQRWDEEIEQNGKVDWALVEPSDDKFEGYLHHYELQDVIANVPSDEDIKFPLKTMK